MLNENAAEYLEAIGLLLTEGREESFTVEENEYGSVMAAELPSPFSEEGRSGCSVQIKQKKEKYFLFVVRLTLLFSLPQELHDEMTALSEAINVQLAAGSFRIERQSGVLYLTQGIIIDTDTGKDAAAVNILSTVSVLANTAENCAVFYKELIEGTKSAEEIISEIGEG